MSFLKKIFASYSERELRKIQHYVDEINALKENSGINGKEKELKVIENSIKEGLFNNLGEGETKISCKQYSLNGTIKEKFNEKKFAKDNPKVYEKYIEKELTYRLSKSKGE